MNSSQLTELIQGITATPGSDSDISLSINNSYSNLHFNPQQSRARSKTLLRASSLSKKRQPPRTSDDFFWNALLPWAKSSESAVTVFEGNYDDRDCVQEIAVKATELIESKCVPLAWGLDVFPRPDDGEEPCRYSGEDIVAQLCLQLLLHNPSLHQRSALDECLAKCEAAKTEAEWFGVLPIFLAGLDEVYLVVDLDVLGRGTSNTASWPTALESMCSNLVGNGINCTVKGLLFTCNVKASFGLSSAITVSKIPQRSANSAARSSDIQFPPDIRGALDGTAEWLQHIGRQKPKRPQSPTAIGRSREEEPIGETMNTISSKRRRRLRTWADYWQAEFEACIDSSRKDDDRRVKIAILDTGADLSHPDIAQADQDGRIKSYDFINDRVDMVDDDGHGTHCTSLLLKYAPNAEVYVGRVFAKSQSLDTAPIVKAIRHAYTEWKVDIISISLGFTISSREMEDEVARATAERVLVFASAGNDTIHEHQPIRFPARMSQVFCVFSANPEGKPSTFNPEPFRPPGLMFPGENIRGAWPASRVSGVPDVMEEGGSTYRTLSGTSCATPIAAAVAAGVLEFIWQPRQDPIERQERFKTFDNMQRVFLNMTSHPMTGGRDFLYIRPWYLISTVRKKDEIVSVLKYFVWDR